MIHSIAVQVKHLMKYIAGKAPEDSVAVRIQEKSLGRFEESGLTASAGTSSKSGSSNNSSSSNSRNFI